MSENIEVRVAVVLENPVAVFNSPQDLEKVLADIERAAFAELEGASLETAKSRKIYGATKRKVASSKVAIDEAGKTLVRDWKAQCRVVDEQRKKARDFLDKLGARVREPLTTWEEAEKAKKDLASAHDEAILDNESFDRLRFIAEREAEATERAYQLAEREAEIKAKEDAVKAKAEREAREKAIAEKAKADAAKAAELAVMKAEESARIAEERRALAEKTAEEEKARAIEGARVEEQRRIRAEQEAEAEKRRIAEYEAEKLRSEAAHVEKIENDTFSSMVRNGISPHLAGKVLELIKSGAIENVMICY